MIPRPIYKILAVPVWLLLSALFVAAWWAWAPDLQRYYMGPRSTFVYERLFLPRFPSLPGTKPVAEHWTILGYPCGAGYCVGSPAYQASGKPLVDVVQYEPREVVKAELNRTVFGGSSFGHLWVALLASGLLLCYLVPMAIVLDFRRRRKILKGVQIQGRWPVTPERFSGWLARFRKNTLVIPVRAPSQKDAPL
jgi:hypothetical protein